MLDQESPLPCFVLREARILFHLLVIGRLDVRALEHPLFHLIEVHGHHASAAHASRPASTFVRRSRGGRLGRFTTRAAHTRRSAAGSAIRCSGPAAHGSGTSTHLRRSIAHAFRGGRNLPCDSNGRTVSESLLAHGDDRVAVGKPRQHLHVIPFRDADFKEPLFGRAVLEQEGVGSLRLGHQGLLLDLQHVLLDRDHQVHRGEHARSQRTHPIPDFHRDLDRAALGVHDGTDQGNPARVGLVRPFHVDAHRLSRSDLSDVLLGHVYTGEQRIEVRRTEYHVIRVHQVAHLHQTVRDDAGEWTADRGVLQLKLRRLVLGCGGLVLELGLFEFLAAEQLLLHQFLGPLVVRFQAVHVHFPLPECQFQGVGVELGQRLPLGHAVSLLDQDGLYKPLRARDHVHVPFRLERRVGQQRRGDVAAAHGLHLDRYGSAGARHGAHAGPAAALILRRVFRIFFTAAAGEGACHHQYNRPVRQFTYPKPLEHEPLLRW